MRRCICPLRFTPSPLLALARDGDLLAPGDRVKLAVLGDRDELTGEYLIPANGRLVVAGTIEIAAAARPRSAVAAELRARLIAAGLIRDLPDNLHLQIEEAVGVDVSVAGAVFDPGLVNAGRAQRGAAWQYHDQPSGRRRLTIPGARYPPHCAPPGGIRPDAAVTRVFLVRGDAYATVDVGPAFVGGDLVDPQVAAGDRVYRAQHALFPARFRAPQPGDSGGDAHLHFEPDAPRQ